MKIQYSIIVVVLLYLLVNVPGLFLPLVINAAKYALIGREILDNQEWVNLTVAGDAYDQKPPLLFWIAAFVFQIFGFSIIAYKTTILFISLIGVYGTYQLGKLLYGKRTGALAAFFWATCFGYAYFHADIHTDSLLVVPVVLSIWQYAAYYKGKGNYHFFLGTIFVGLAMLAKGPVGMAIPASAVGLHLLMSRNYKAIFNYRWLLAIPVVGILILPALWGLYEQFGFEGIKFYFWTNNVGRITGSYHGNNSDPFFYVHTSLYIMAPWALFGLTGFFMQVREKIQKWGKFTADDEFYLIGGFFFYFLVTSIAKAKYPHHEMAILPLVLILGARWALVIFEGASFNKLKRIISSMHLLISILVFMLVFIFLLYVFPENRLWIWFVVVAMTVLFIYVLTWKKSLSKQLAYLLISISTFLFILNVHIIPSLIRYHSTFEACRIFNEQANDKAKLHIFTEEARYWDIFLYSKNYGSYIVTRKDYRQISPPSNDWVYTGAEGVGLLSKMKVKADTIQVFEHQKISKVPLQFYVPRMRQSELSKFYLLKITDR
jgi:4-amino-4-deoxy-L-arabinose transferase-like glycosyltransferase